MNAVAMVGACMIHQDPAIAQFWEQAVMRTHQENLPEGPERLADPLVTELVATDAVAY